MSELILFWHRRDLRVTDNMGLAEARKITSKIVGLFCLDPQIIKRDDIAPARMTYMIGCLQHLQESYRKLGSQLLIFHQDPVEIIPRLITTLNPRSLYFNLDGEPYAQKRDNTIISHLKKSGIEIQTFWDQLLHSPLDIKTGMGNPYTVYTPFWKNWLNHLKPQPLPDVEILLGLTENEQEKVQKLGLIPLPNAPELGFIWNQPLFLEPGETVAQNQLEKFINSPIYHYQEKRNFPAIVGTSQLSPALKFGVISIRKIWQKIQNLEKNANSIEQQNIKIWQQELAWREFYQHALYHFPELEKGPYRDLFKNFPWENNPQHFQAWCEGKTGYPIVDAAMRQLNHTGWMHNRCRMIVASFLTKDLIINWQWGEKYFMQTLIDGDLAANNGGWQWSASSGMDPRPLRIFNPASQAEKFDPEGEYIRYWIPELKSVDTKTLLTGKLTPLEARLRGYVTPIVDHHQQQKRFKELYQQQKNKLS